MTARSDDEIRDLAEFYLYDGDSDQPINDGYYRLFDLAAKIRTEHADLLDSRERAIRWAVTLEGQLAAVAAIVTELDEGMTVGVIRQALADRLRAALTGSTE